MRIGILHCGEKPHDFCSCHGDYPQLIRTAFESDDLEFESEYKVFRGDFPPNIEQMDAWFLTGSPAGVYENKPWIGRLLKFIREAYESGIPMVGICFGHQAIAQALGGRVEKYPGGWALGVNTYLFLLRDVQRSRPVRMFALHQDQVVEKPEMAEIIAENSFTKYAGLKYGSQIVTFQFHPEITKKAMEDILKDRGLPAIEVINAKKTLSQRTDEEVIIKYIGDFLRKSHRTRTDENCFNVFCI